MSNKCPHCGAAGGKSHEPCPYGPGGKFAKPKPKNRLTAEEVRAVSAKALEQAPKKTVEIVETPAGTFIHETAPVPEEALTKLKASGNCTCTGGPFRRGTTSHEPGCPHAAPADRKAIAAELQAKATAVQGWRQARSREGKKAITVWASPETLKALKTAAVKYEVTQEAIVGEAIAEILAGKYKL